MASLVLYKNEIKHEYYEGNVENAFFIIMAYKNYVLFTAK